MTALENDRLLRALAREPVDRTPVWLMRQAGRYLPEYRKTRAQAGSFLKLCATPELACEVTLQPLRRYALDAAILFSDILTIPWAMGLGLEFVDGEGPRFASPIRSNADIDRLGVPDPERDLGFVLDAVRLIRAELHGQVPLIGFAGSPWTLATYMVEGSSSKDFRLIKGLMFDDARALHRLLEVLSQAVARYLNAQITAGAQALMIFDTWGGMLSTPGFSEFSLRYLEQVVGDLMRNHDGCRIPVVLFTKGGGEWLERCAGTGCDAIGVDWSVDLARARARVGSQVALQGNLDPTVLQSSSKRIREEVAQVLAAFGAGAGHVFNLGHGVQPGTAPEGVAACIDAVHALSPAYHDAM